MSGGRRTLAGFGLTWGRKVHFSTFDGKLTFQCTTNDPQNPPFCPGSLQDTFIIYSSISRQHISQTYFGKLFSRIEHLEIWKSKNPGSLTGAQHKAQDRWRIAAQQSRLLLVNLGKSSFPQKVKKTVIRVEIGEV